jgi:integrase
MKKPSEFTKCTVKLRKTSRPDEYYLFLESYPVYEYGSDKPKRIYESLNRLVNTPIWDRTEFTRSGMPQVKRDRNGIIQCRSIQDQESCIFADNVRKLRQNEYDMKALYPEKEKERMAQEERSRQDFIKYFEKITYSHHPNSSDSIVTNWERVGTLLRLYSDGEPIPVKNITVKWMEDFKRFLLTAPQGGNKKGTISQNTASTYFSILKAGVKQAFVDDLLPVDVSAKVKGIPTPETQRQFLTIDEVNKLVDTPCEHDVVKRAFLFSVLTGMRHCDIKSLRWINVEESNGSYRINFTQQKTDVPDYLPISEQAYQLCGERRQPNRLVFEGLKNPSWIKVPLKKWVEAAGITKHITFHCARHTFATLQLNSGTSIFTVSKMLGHTNIKTTQIYTHLIDAKKEEAANAIKIKNIK